MLGQHHDRRLLEFPVRLSQKQAAQAGHVDTAADGVHKQTEALAAASGASQTDVVLLGLVEEKLLGRWDVAQLFEDVDIRRVEAVGQPAAK
jgi:hypothetical protein